MSRTISELSALTEALHIMRKSSASSREREIYKYFCKPEAGTMKVRLYACLTGYIHIIQCIWGVQFWYVPQYPGRVSAIDVKVTKLYKL